RHRSGTHTLRSRYEFAGWPYTSTPFHGSCTVKRFADDRLSRPRSSTLVPCPTATMSFPKVRFSFFSVARVTEMIRSDQGPNAGAHLLPEADATQERTLEAVRCSAWLGPYAADAAVQRAGTAADTLSHPASCLSSA